jgi:hypothetical protein
VGAGNGGLHELDGEVSRCSVDAGFPIGRG